MTDTVLAQGGGGQNIFLLPNGTFFAVLIIFGVVLFVLWKYIVPPIRNAMAERHDRAQRQLEETERANQRFAEADSRYREALSEARSESSKIRDDARAEGNRSIEELRERANADATEVRERGERQLAEQRERAVADLRSHVGELSSSLASRIVGVDVRTGSEATVQRFLDERGERGAGVSGTSGVSGGA